MCSTAILIGFEVMSRLIEAAALSIVCGVRAGEPAGRVCDVLLPASRGDSQSVMAGWRAGSPA